MPNSWKDTAMSTSDQAPDHLIDQLVDTDPQETAEWTQSLDAVLKNAGPVRARYLMLADTWIFYQIL